MKAQIETEIEAALQIHDDEGVRDYIVYGDYDPGQAMTIDHYGVPTDPPVPAHIVYGGAEDMEGNEVILNQEDEEAAMDALWDSLEN